MKHSTKVIALFAMPAYNLQEAVAFVSHKSTALVTLSSKRTTTTDALLPPPSFWVAKKQTRLRASEEDAEEYDEDDLLDYEEWEMDEDDDALTYEYSDVEKRTASSFEEQEFMVLESRMSALTSDQKTVTTQPEAAAVQAEAPKGIWDKSNTIVVQGNSLRTWSYTSSLVQRVQVSMNTEGRPMDANVELWQGPDNTPVKMRVYVENGTTRPFNCVVETPGSPNTLAIRNVGQIEFPLTASVAANSVSPDYTEELESGPSGMVIQGGALKTYPFESEVDSVQVLIKTDGRPLNARIELLQGPNNNKQVCEIYTEDGIDRPFYVVMDTPGSGNVVRIVNTAPVEFPMSVWIDAKDFDDTRGPTDVVLGGDAHGGW